jgi:hypothetical protein
MTPRPSTHGAQQLKIVNDDELNLVALGKSKSLQAFSDERFGP